MRVRRKVWFSCSEECASRQNKAQSGRGAHDFDNCALCPRAECRIYARASTHTKCATRRDQRTHLLSIFTTTYLRYFLRGTLLTRADRMKYLLLSTISRTMLVVRGLNLTGQFAMYTQMMLLLFIETCSQLYTLSGSFLYGW